MWWVIILLVLNGLNFFGFYDGVIGWIEFVNL